jgi:CheY-like chemotaxis protein
MTMKKVFVVEDNKLFTAAVTDLLTLHGVDYSVVREKPGINSSDILEQIKQYKPNILILDIRMPFADGLEICRCVKNHPELRFVYIIILSALDSDKDVEAGERQPMSTCPSLFLRTGDGRHQSGQSKRLMLPVLFAETVIA